jgi:hypothetical protein
MGDWAAARATEEFHHAEDIRFGIRSLDERRGFRCSRRNVVGCRNKKRGCDKESV